MPYDVKWYVEGRVIHDRLYGGLTMNDVVETSQILTKMLKKEQLLPLIHVIVDLREMDHLPLGFSVNKVNLSINHMKEPTLGWHILVTTNPLARFLASVITQISKARLRVFTSFEDGLAFLATQDESLAEFLDIKQPAG